VDRATAEDWIRSHVEPVGAIETEHERPWATVLRVPLAEGVVWFKACAPVQAFEPRLTAELFARWPDRVAEVLGHDEKRAWLLLADAGTPIGVFGNPPEAWLIALPLYAELQRGEAAHTHDHLAHGVPDLRVATLPARYEDLLLHDLPLERNEIRRLRDFAPRFAELCAELASHALPETVQHDDLQMANLYVQGKRLRLLDWGDASISHPFRVACRHIPVPRRAHRAAARRPVVRPIARRVSGALGSGSRPALRARDPRRRLRPYVCMGASAGPPTARGTPRVR
jgi:hypothetical protein